MIIGGSAGLRMMIALPRSAPPMVSTPAAVGARARLRFVSLYARARHLSRSAARRLARAAEVKARRMAAHVPRHVDPDDALRGSGA